MSERTLGRREVLYKVKGKGIDVGLVLGQTAQLPFYYTSQYSLATLGATRSGSSGRLCVRQRRSA